eukprot:Trichotokara_eunicae@DN6234_c3_g2_i3.p1
MMALSHTTPSTIEKHNDIKQTAQSAESHAFGSKTPNSQHKTWKQTQSILILNTPHQAIFSNLSDVAILGDIVSALCLEAQQSWSCLEAPQFWSCLEPQQFWSCLEAQQLIYALP